MLHSSLLAAHLRRKKLLEQFPKCCIENCKGKVLWGCRYGKIWKSKYCRKHAILRKKHAIRLKRTLFTKT